jgi:hypothetical protein
MRQVDPTVPSSGPSLKKYGLEFPVLLCGDLDKANAKLSQLANWNTWPATLFVDRKGRVRGIHAGFASPGNHELFREEEDHFKPEAGGCWPRSNLIIQLIGFLVRVSPGWSRDWIQFHLRRIPSRAAVSSR